MSGCNIDHFDFITPHICFWIQCSYAFIELEMEKIVVVYRRL